MDRNLIIDVGVDTGQDTKFSLKKGFRVVGIEAHPDIYESIKRQLNSYIESGQLTLLKITVSSKDEPITFYANLDRSFWSTISPDRVKESDCSFSTPSLEMTVTGSRFESILEEFRIPYYLKVDIEGSEPPCISVLGRTDAKPQFISIESTKASWNALLEELELLKKLGYQQFQAVNQAKLTQEVCSSPARKGKYILYQFECGASGLFGEETPSDCPSESEVLKVYKGIFTNYKIFGVNGIIYHFAIGKILLRSLTIKEPWYDINASL
ncbi:FkbM family methyltransferase [Trichormus azollae]|uniref:FkbM family methyltransferase n=1 Tax=Trichormus azollae TaxID=1164 RepID=UPI00325F6132